MAGIEVQGLANVNAMLRKCSKEVQKAVRKEATAVGNIVRDEIRGRAPVDSGLLRRSVRTSVRRLGVAVRDNAVAEDGYRYGRRIEFDPKVGGSPGTGRFFYPGFQAKLPEARERFDKALSGVIRTFGR